MEENKEYSARQKDEQEFYNKVYSSLEEDEDAARIRLEEPPVTNCGMEPYVQEIFEWIGNLKGKKVLEVGGGGGLYGLWMALQGAEVTILDVADQALEFARKREVLLRQRFPDAFMPPVQYRVLPAEQLDREYPENSFDLVCGFQMLHHLETEPFASALNKILKSSGRAFFCFEPYYFLKLMAALRYSRLGVRLFPEGRQTQFERRLTAQDLAHFEKYFKMDFLPGNLIFINLTRRLFRNSKQPWLWPVFKFLFAVEKKTKWSYDQFGDVESRGMAMEYKILRRFPSLRVFCGNAHVLLKKKEG